MGISAAHPTTDDESEYRTTGTLVRGRLPSEAFALDETFTSVSDLTVECAPFAAAGEAANMSLLWAETDDDDLTNTLVRDPSVSSVEELWRTDDRQLYRMDWTHDVHCCTQILLQSEGIILNSRGTDGEWNIDLLYPDRETLRHVNESCEQYDLPLTIDTIRSLSPDQQSQYGLTAVQRETLTTACQQGYFNVPREIGLKELAEKTNISHQALSERLRRGHNALIKATLLESYPTPPSASSL